MGWFRAISVGGGVLDVPRRGQDPSLRFGVIFDVSATTGRWTLALGAGIPVSYGVVEG